MSQFKQKLSAIFEKGGEFGPAEVGRDRYVPRALNGGPGWEVFDRQEDRFLSNKEVRAIPLETLRDAEIRTVH